MGIIDDKAGPPGDGGSLLNYARVCQIGARREDGGELVEEARIVGADGGRFAGDEECAGGVAKGALGLIEAFVDDPGVEGAGVGGIGDEVRAFPFAGSAGRLSQEGLGVGRCEFDTQGKVSNDEIRMTNDESNSNDE